MKKLLMILAAASSLAGATILLAQQQRGPGGPGRGGLAPLAPFYTSKLNVLGPADTAAADRACPSAGHSKLVCLSNFLKKELSPALLARLQLPYSAADGQKWSNFPPMVYRDRVGVTLGEFNAPERGVIKALLKQVAGVAADEGYDEIAQILNADDFLQENTKEMGFASGNFHIAFLGTPAARGTWQFYFGGHHLALTNTYKDGALVGATPSFRGVEPFTTFKENGRDNAPMAQEQAAFVALLNALSPEQQTKAKLSQTFTDIIVGPQQDNTIPVKHAGLRAGDLKDAQRVLLTRAIETYVGDLDGRSSAAILKKYRDELAETWIAYSGTTGLNAENDYVRIDGPSVWIEISMQPGRSVPGIHPHSVWRDRSGDYGGNK